MYPLVRELAVQDAPVRVPVTVTCRVLKIARAPYYRWLANPVTDADWAAAHRANALFDAHRDDPEFGYRLLADEARDAGQDMCDRTAWAICSGNAWWSVFGKKRSTRPRPGPPAHDDRVQRDFTATGPNQLWLTDITEHRTREGKVYMCAVKDVWSNRLVGYAISSRMKARLAVQALEHAVDTRARAGVDVAGCIVHSDRGSQGLLLQGLRPALQEVRRHPVDGRRRLVGRQRTRGVVQRHDEARGPPRHRLLARRADLPPAGLQMARPLQHPPPSQLVRLPLPVHLRGPPGRYAANSRVITPRVQDPGVRPIHSASTDWPRLVCLQTPRRSPLTPTARSPTAAACRRCTSKSGAGRGPPGPHAARLLAWRTSATTCASRPSA